jgi:hypothetical protein
MDLITFWSSVISSIGATAGSAWWLGRRWVNHRLELEIKKSEAHWQGEVRKEVENYLADRAAEREYALNAKRRLYEAIGPLRFQLLKACRDLAKHVRNYGLSKSTNSLEPDDYYGQSTLFRLIMPLTIVELIERQIAIADFAVDPSAVDLLRFKKAAFSALQSSEPILNHPKADWDNQREHIFHHRLTVIANNTMIRNEGVPDRPMMFDEFSKLLSDQRKHERVHPFIRILKDFTIEKKPIFWIRLVFYAYVCAELVNKMGVNLSFERVEINPEELLSLSKDKFTEKNIKKLCSGFKELLDAGL